ncbi:hypothetical protein GCM10020331_001750 [Ectobacillus funiculus]
MLKENKGYVKNMRELFGSFHFIGIALRHFLRNGRMKSSLTAGLMDQTEINCIIKISFLAVSTGSAKERYRAGGRNQYSMSELLKPFQATSNLIGTKFFYRLFVFNGTYAAIEEEIQESARAYVNHILATDIFLSERTEVPSMGWSVH